eukprot:scaffold8259_cov62-Cyclotella_meneghiniana.AAC.1
MSIDNEEECERSESVIGARRVTRFEFMESTFPTQNTITITPSERSHPKTYGVQCTSAGHNSNVAIVLLTDQAAVTLQSKATDQFWVEFSKAGGV